MELFSPRHVLILIIAYWVVIWPLALILARAGHSKWMSLLFLIPIINIIFLWWFALSKWPVEPRPG